MMLDDCDEKMKEMKDQNLHLVIGLLPIDYFVFPPCHAQLLSNLFWDCPLLSHVRFTIHCVWQLVSLLMMTLLNVASF